MTIGWPQAIWLILVFLSACVHARRNGQPRGGNYDLGAMLLNSALMAALLYWGGFFS